MKNPYFNTALFRAASKKAVDLICRTYDNLGKIKVNPDIKPGYIRTKIPDSPPEQPEDINKIFEDTEKLILPNNLQWHHPNFFGYYPANMSHYSVLGEMIALSFNTPGFTWHVSQAATELENVIADWGVKMLGLPHHYLLKNKGGGMISNSIGDDIFLSIHAAKYRKLKELNLTITSPETVKLVGYYPETSHHFSYKAMVLKDVPYHRILPVVYNTKEQNYIIDVPKFEELVKEDLSKGLIPFWFGATVGSTPTGARDPLEDIVPICKKYKMWVNVDCAYTGSSFICPEFHEIYTKGLEGVDSLEINFAKKLMAGNNSALFYVADRFAYNEALAGKGTDNHILPEIMRNAYTNEIDVTDYKDWQVGLGRRWNSLRFWFLIRSLGVEGLRKFVRQTVDLAKIIENKVKADDRFEMFCKRELTLICFRATKDYKGRVLNQSELNDFNLKLVETINKEGDYIITGSIINDIYFIRFTCGNPNTEAENIESFWKVFLNQYEKQSL